MVGPLWTLALVSAGQVWIVDPSSGSGFTDVQPAIDAARDGDLILIRSGHYAPFTVRAKSLRVLADAGASVEIYGTVTVRDLAPSGVVLLGGIEMDGSYAQPVSDPGLDLVDNLGFVRVEDCAAHGGIGYGDVSCYDIGDGGPGVHAQGNARVVLERCTASGGSGGSDYFGTCDGGAGGNGVTSSDSTIALFDCSIYGGGGGYVEDAYAPGTGGRGGQGCLHLGGRLFGSRTLFEGGNGGVHWNGGDGGDGLEVDAAEADLRSCVFHAGRGAPGSSGSSGQDGLARTGNGDFEFPIGPARIVSAPLLVADNGILPITVVGLAGDRVWIVRSARPAHQYVPSVAGLRLAQAPVARSLDPQGVVPASGTLEIDLPVPRLSAGTTFDAYFYQAIVQDVAGRFFLCGPLHPTVFRCAGLVPDCNGNGKFDTCDLLNGTSTDCDHDGHPDDCEPDCNANGVADACDIAGGTSLDRNGNGIPDECEPNRTWYVDAAAASGGDGSAAHPLESIGAAIAPSISGDTILVRDGVYTGAVNRGLDFGGRDLVLRSEHGATACTIDCQGADLAFFLQRQESAASRIEGFTIRNGHAYGGAAIRLLNADVTIADCAFVNCQGTFGGAVLLEGSRSELRGCSFVGNRAEEGGGLAVDTGLPWIHDCTFEGNAATYRGGGALIEAFGTVSNPIVAECRFFANHADVRGGGLDLVGPSQAQYPPIRLVQCVLAGNTAPNGAAVTSRFGRAQIFDSTIVDNVASTTSTVRVLDAGYLGIVNSILSDNVSADGLQATLAGAGSTLRIGYCVFRGGQAAIGSDPGTTLIFGAGNLDLDPRFVDPDGADDDPTTFDDNDYRLSASSPCLDAGDDTEVPADAMDVNGNGNTTEPWPFDLDGHPRFVDQPSVPDTGVGPPPVVDLGCYERP